MKRLRFGILGTGNIARQFAASFATSRAGTITAVGSRQPATAEAFVAAQCPAAAATSYEGLLARDDVDAVYVSLPNALHHRWTLAALAAGKHVLCEKPLAMNATEAEEMFDAAGKAGKVLMEAFMYVSHPLLVAAKDVIRSGTLGRVRHVRTSFCFRARKVEGNVRFDKPLGGGAMLDVGCYCVHFSRQVAQLSGAATEPADVWAAAVRHEPSGVDEQVAGLMRFAVVGGPDITATFACGMAVQADNTATVSGDEAYLELPVPWKPPVTHARLVIARSIPPKQDGPVAGSAPPPREERAFDAGKDLYALEADDFADAVAGRGPLRITPADSLANARTLDRILAQIGG